MAATLRDVARLAEVSIKTVSNVIHDHPNVRDETRARVQSAIEELDYQPNMSARGLRSGRTGAIGLAIPSIRENYFAELADAVIEAADLHGVSVLVSQTNGLREAELDVLSGRRLRLTDGLLFSPASLGQDDRDLLNVRFPLVLLGERMFDGPTDHVTMLNIEAATAAVEHLISRGRRRIALLGVDAERLDEAGSANLRAAGYQLALQQAGIAYDPALVVGPAHWDHDDAAEATRALIRSGAPFDAVFAMNDTLAVGALRALAEARFRVPEDIAIIGFDDIEATRFSIPSLSSVDPGRSQIARLAVERLLHRIEEKNDRQPPQRFTTDFTIVARESTDHPAERSVDG
ncbi:LacI family DNA-binding transcriptional regulator [Amnibacterium flavum]|uniref:LacI family transcriptional regulator n=1 Tax=Amnibacterium flavum TaxID=2173173 RepID=A0A2V1HRR6_9MICO|nr:LacI family DNA-binding transcriptional regulator [Amnibacterium flavum]PVZ93799.1 LacI family transcriptional regulator [Amnibacterium flavum]